MGIHGLSAGTRALSGRLEVHVGKLGIRLHRELVRPVWDGGKIKKSIFIVQLRAILVLMELGQLGVRGLPVQKRVEMAPKVGVAHAPEHGAQERRVPITEAVHQTLRPAI